MGWVFEDVLTSEEQINPEEEFVQQSVHFQTPRQAPRPIPKKGWVFDDVQQAEQKQPETSFLRAAGAGIKNFLLGGIGAGGQALSGGAPEFGEQLGIAQEQFAWDQQAKPLLEQGLSESEVIAQLGERPELTPTLEEFTDELTGGQLIPQTPFERTIAKGGETAGEFATIGALLPGVSTLTSIGKEAATGGLFGVGENIAKEQGEGPVGQIATGALMAMTPFLLRKGKAGIEKSIDWGRQFGKVGELPTGLPRFLTEAGTPKALADLELSFKDLLGRTAKVSETEVSKFEDLVGKVSEPVFEDIGTFRAADIEKDILKANQSAILDSISPAAKTQKQSWDAIQKYVEGNFGAMKNTYSKLYEIVETQAKNVPVIPTATAETASKIYNDLEQSIVKAPEEGGVKKSLEELVNLLRPMKTGNIVEIPLSQLMAGKRSINRLLQKSDIIPGPIDLLKPVSAAMKKDTLAALENTGIKTVFEAAENQFAEAQRVYNNDAIKKFRKSQNVEEMGSFFTKPSNLERLQNAIGENKMVKDFSDRMVVESITGKSKHLAEELANENRQFLGKKAQESMDKLLEFGNSLTAPGQQSLARGNILNDIQKAFGTGARPDFTLKMMQNPTGYNLVKQTLERSPKGKRMMKSLQRMTFEDMMNSVIGKDKHIDFEKSKDILSNPHLKNVVKEALGEEGLKFFEKLETYGKNMSENLQRFKTKDPSIFQKFIDNYLGSNLKYLLFAFTPKGAAVSILAGEGIKRAQRVRLFRTIENPASRKVLKDMGQKNVSPDKMKTLIKRFAQFGSQVENEE